MDFMNFQELVNNTISAEFKPHLVAWSIHCALLIDWLIDRSIHCSWIDTWCMDWLVDWLIGANLTTDFICLAGRTWKAHASASSWAHPSPTTPRNSFSTSWSSSPWWKRQKWPRWWRTRSQRPKSTRFSGNTSNRSRNKPKPSRTTRPKPATVIPTRRKSSRAPSWPCGPSTGAPRRWTRSCGAHSGGVKSKISPNGQPLIQNPLLIYGIKFARVASGWTYKVSKKAVKQVGHVSLVIARYLAPKITASVEKTLPRSWTQSADANGHTRMGRCVRCGRVRVSGRVDGVRGVGQCGAVLGGGLDRWDGADCQFEVRGGRGGRRIHRLVSWKIGCACFQLIIFHQFVDWLIDWFKQIIDFSCIQWPVDWLFDSNHVLVFVYSFGLLIDWLTFFQHFFPSFHFFISFVSRLIDWLVDWLILRLFIDWLVGWLIDWLAL